MKASLVILSVFLTLTFASCKRDHLYFASAGTATVLVRPNWQSSGVHPNGVTIFAYNESDGSLYKRFPPVSAGDKCYIRLPEGDFTLLVMNDTPEEFDGRIEFTGTENLATVQAKGVRDERMMKDVGDYCIVEPDTLAVSLVRNLHITPEQFTYYYDMPETDTPAESSVEVDVTPEPVLSQVNVKAHVKGLKYAKGATYSLIKGVAGGRMLGLETNSRETVSQSFILNNRKFDPGSDSDGTITASFLSFGLVGDGTSDDRYFLEINFVLINGESYPIMYDVTDLISIDITLNLQLSLKLDLEIELPEVEHDEGGGFKTEISDWDDEIVDIPM